MMKRTKPQPCATERYLTKLFHEFEKYALTHPHLNEWDLFDIYAEYTRERWDNPRTRLTNMKHFERYAPVPGRVAEAVARVHRHYVMKEFVDDAGDAPQNLKPLNKAEDLWKYAHQIRDFEYGKYKTDKTYSAMWAVAILTGNRICHIARCVSLRLKYENADHEGLPASIVVRWGRRKGATTPSTVEYATEGLPVPVWRYIKEAWEKTERPFCRFKTSSIASCANRWLKEKRKFRISRGLANEETPIMTSSSPRIYGVNRDLDLLHNGELTKERYEVRTGHTVAVAERTYRRTRASPTTVGRKDTRPTRHQGHPTTGKKIGRK